MRPWVTAVEVAVAYVLFDEDGYLQCKYQVEMDVLEKY